jgi:hypothetical protein
VAAALAGIAAIVSVAQLLHPRGLKPSRSVPVATAP